MDAARPHAVEAGGIETLVLRDLPPARDRRVPDPDMHRLVVGIDREQEPARCPRP